MAVTPCLLRAGGCFNEPLPPLFHEEAGVSYHLHQRSFCAEEGGLLPLDECIGSLLDESSKQHRHHTDGAVQPFYYFLLTQSVDTLASFVRSSFGRRRAALCLRYFALHERHDAPCTHTGTQTGGKMLFFSFGRQDRSGSYTTPRFHASECHVVPAYKPDTSSLSRMTNSRVFALVCGLYAFSFSCSAAPLRRFRYTHRRRTASNTSRQTVSLFYGAHPAAVFRILTTRIVSPVRTFSIGGILFDISIGDAQSPPVFYSAIGEGSVFFFP
jgi:hypothetical protein